MCGLAGTLWFVQAPRGGGLAPARRLSEALAHRGPDGHGIHGSADGRLQLVHRRLAVIDPTEAAAQPMSTPDGRHWLVYNGEVLNYRELRRELVADGASFRTRSDTEVVLQLLIRRGPDGLARLRGMFALAWWDEREHSLLVARDRFGIKPLYVAADERRVVFASEVGALRRAGLVDRRVSPAGVLSYLTWGSILPPLTWLEGVESLFPGTWRRWDGDGGMTGGRYADIRERYLEERSDARISEPLLREHARAAVESTVRAHLVADVPVGVFLSGGIDSSAIVAAARAVSTTDLRTFTVVVDEAPYSEEAHAQQVARRFGTHHQCLRVRAGTIRDDLPEILARMDQPTADGVNAYYVSRAAAAAGVKAVLSGAGADEIFGGYPSFRRMPAVLRWRSRLGLALPVVRALGAQLPTWQRAKWRHLWATDDVLETYRALRGLWMPDEQGTLLGPALRETGERMRAGEALSQSEAALLDSLGPEPPVATVSRLETRLYLGSQLLRDLDAMSMAHGLEVRVPYVDHPLATSLWPSLAQHSGLMRNKRLLYETLRHPLPPCVYERPKRGFLLPFPEWLGNGLGEIVREGMQDLVRLGWIDARTPQTVWHGWERGQMHWSRPWALGMLGRFLTVAP